MCFDDTVVTSEVKTVYLCVGVSIVRAFLFIVVMSYVMYHYSVDAGVA